MSYLEDRLVDDVQYWNPLLGCSPVSPGCDNCIALDTVNMQGGRPQLKDYKTCVKKTRGVLKWSGKIVFREERLVEPAKHRPPTFYYTCSLSDLFHEKVSVRRINQVFEAMSNAPQHRFQVITKRIERALSISPRLKWPDNIVLGASVENRDHLHRLDALRQIPARLKFACFEPLLGPIPKVDLTGLDGVVVGGEFGRKWRSPDLSWVRSIREMCQECDIPFYFSQHGGRGKRRTGRQLDGREWTDLPIGLWSSSATSSERLHAQPRVLQSEQCSACHRGLAKKLLEAEDEGGAL